FSTRTSLGRENHMAKHKYLTSPPNLTGMPPGVPYIIGNEAADRFSYYGMKSVLTVFMAHYILNQSGVLAPMSPNEAYMYTHYFVFGVYFLPILGAIIADGWLGKYRTILYLSIVYCFGNSNHDWGKRHCPAHNASHRTVLNLFGRRWNQAVRVRERWRSIRRIEQTFALENVWLVLFFHQCRFIYFFDSLSMVSFESEVGTGLGVWNSRHSDGYRYFVLLEWPQKNGTRAASGSRLSARNVQSQRSAHAGEDRHGL